MCNSCSQDGKNSEHNVFGTIPVRPNQDILLSDFIQGLDCSSHTRQALVFDVRKFAKWYCEANAEPWDVGRVTFRDVADFRDHLHKDRKQASSTINRCLISIRKYFKWLAVNNHVSNNPVQGIKELKRQPLAPQGLDRPDVRKLLREAELRSDIRSTAIFSLMLYTGARLSDVVQLERTDLVINERSGTVIYRYGKGSKQRTVPVPLPARKALLDYLQTRPPIQSEQVFIGERGALNNRGIQAIFEKYKALTGIEQLHPHVLRHTFSHSFLAQGGNLSQLAQILGHESLNTTAIYTRNSMGELSDAAERLTY
jgi:site-specific recombinase XerD